MVRVRQTVVFRAWFEALRDRIAQKRILVRIGRLERGLFGDAKSVGEGVGELRVDHGPGYRLYFTRRGEDVVILLCGGDKSSQQRDVAAALRLAREAE